MKCLCRIMPSTSLEEISFIGEDELNLQLDNKTTGQKWQQQTNAVVLATGYQNQVPDFLLPVHDRINWTDDGKYNLQFNYSIDNDHTLFVQNADLHTHGFNSADLGMGPYRNAIILNSILGKEHFRTEKGSIFQSFGLL